MIKECLSAKCSFWVKTLSSAGQPANKFAVLELLTKAACHWLVGLIWAARSVGRSTPPAGNRNQRTCALRNASQNRADFAARNADPKLLAINFDSWLRFEKNQGRKERRPRLLSGGGLGEPTICVPVVGGGGNTEMTWFSQGR